MGQSQPQEKGKNCAVFASSVQALSGELVLNQLWGDSIPGSWV